MGWGEAGLDSLSPYMWLPASCLHPHRPGVSPALGTTQNASPPGTRDPTRHFAKSLEWVVVGGAKTVVSMEEAQRSRSPLGEDLTSSPPPPPPRSGTGQ